MFKEFSEENHGVIPSELKSFFILFLQLCNELTPEMSMLQSRNVMIQTLMKLDLSIHSRLALKEAFTHAMLEVPVPQTISNN